VGSGDKKAALDAVMADAHERDIPCRFTGLTERDIRLLEELYPGRFFFHCDRDSYDYVYAIDDLAELKGKKYQKKRNHVNRFRAAHPDCRVQPLSAENLEGVKALVDGWYETRLAQDPTADFLMERRALEKALRDYEKLGMESLVLLEGERVLAFTMGSFLAENTLDVHFEKAREDVDGAYTAINQQMAFHLREKHPELRFLDREDDMGLEGLRKAKLSYNPVRLVEKYWARLWEEDDED
jgi:hypothetical protein